MGRMIVGAIMTTVALGVLVLPAAAENAPKTSEVKKTPPQEDQTSTSGKESKPLFRPKNSLSCEFLGPCGKCDCTEPATGHQDK